ncbi:poly-gamma-glutamate biosynthesis protein PgsC/CapC [Streptomyces sp. NPDC092307]|uniref:poly-gamma-glutamate biosynthesis protein PgsC/CapC n=1 Tax=Streptomyces sp. NPDC092307 TaxID=3366013 RepID=UPI0037F844A5
MNPAVLIPAAAAIGIGLGLVLALVSYLTTGLSPGGMMTPGWLAVTLVSDARLFAVIAAVTFVTYGLGSIAQAYVILYGKRLFAATVLIGVLLQAALTLLLSRELPLLYTNQTLGFVVPGLISYQLTRQPTGPTLLATGVTTLLTYVLLLAGVLLGFVPHL